MGDLIAHGRAARRRRSDEAREQKQEIERVRETDAELMRAVHVAVAKFLWQMRTDPPKGMGACGDCVDRLLAVLHCARERD